MKSTTKFLLASASLMLAFSIVAPALHAQDAQQTTTTRESTTTTDVGAPPLPPEQMAAPMPGYAEFGYKDDNFAAHRGYNDGYNKGISDRSTGHSYRPTSDRYYNHPIGYNGGGISKGEYDRVYREAFLHGYERGFRK
jgi:hypothetical protein